MCRAQRQRWARAGKQQRVGPERGTSLPRRSWWATNPLWTDRPAGAAHDRGKEANTIRVVNQNTCAARS